MRGARRRAGLAQASCHQLRHTCFTRLREAGMSIEALQAQAGHASIETTRVYLHLTNDWLAGEYRKAQKRIDADRVGGVPMSAVAAVTGPLERPKVPSSWEEIDAAVPQLAATMLALSGPGHGVFPALDGVVDGNRLADLRRVPDRSRPGVELCRRHRPLPRRGVQGLATRPARHDRQTVQDDLVPAAHRKPAHVLHPHHRVGLGRRPRTSADLLR